MVVFYCALNKKFNKIKLERKVGHVSKVTFNPSDLEI